MADMCNVLRFGITHESLYWISWRVRKINKRTYAQEGKGKLFPFLGRGYPLLREG
jgi:hypothetical protein